MDEDVWTSLKRTGANLSPKNDPICVRLNCNSKFVLKDGFQGAGLTSDTFRFVGTNHRQKPFDREQAPGQYKLKWVL